MNSFPYEYAKTLVYFKKGDEKWGTPNYLVGTQEVLQPISTIMCYPNPFTTSTTLSYVLDKPENVQFTIYTLQGQIVFMMQERQDKGEHSVIWNAAGLPAGLYITQFQAGNNIVSRKLLLAP
ncbi:MAG: T9SS type A sorting domain-containing protein [Bacteroidota bacterium]|nr:T9SS type A sorting domain-containing protein [Bacteroidota bacterium]